MHLGLFVAKTSSTLTCTAPLKVATRERLLDIWQREDLEKWTCSLEVLCLNLCSEFASWFFLTVFF